MPGCNVMDGATGVEFGVAVGVDVGVAVGVGVIVAAGVGVGVAVGTGGPACSHVIITSFVNGLPDTKSIGKLQNWNAWYLPSPVATKSCLYLPISGVAAVLSVLPAACNALVRAVR